MEEKSERIQIVGPPAWYGSSCYIKEVERKRFITSEKSEVYVYNSVEMFNHLGQTINYLV